jgi:hypothetical protein
MAVVCHSFGSLFLVSFLLTIWSPFLLFLQRGAKNIGEKKGWNCESISLLLLLCWFSSKVLVPLLTFRRIGVPLSANGEGPKQRKKCGWCGVLGSFTTQWRFYAINYLATSDLRIIWHCIYEERDEHKFMRMKTVKLVSKTLESEWNYHCEWFCFMAAFLSTTWS